MVDQKDVIYELFTDALAKARIAGEEIQEFKMLSFACDSDKAQDSVEEVNSIYPFIVQLHQCYCRSVKDGTFLELPDVLIIDGGGNPDEFEECHEEVIGGSCSDWVCTDFMFHDGLAIAEYEARDESLEDRLACAFISRQVDTCMLSFTSAKATFFVKMDTVPIVGNAVYSVYLWNTDGLGGGKIVKSWHNTDAERLWTVKNYL